MATSAAIDLASQLIRHYEGFVPQPYQDSEGIWTVGTGFTYWMGKPVTQHYPAAITTAEDSAALVLYLPNTEGALNRSMPKVWGSLNKNQQAALISFSFNTGWQCGDAGFDSLNKAITGGKLYNVPVVLKKYTNGKLLGLVRRRRAEGLVWYGQSPVDAIANALKENPQ